MTLLRAVMSILVCSLQVAVTYLRMPDTEKEFFFFEKTQKVYCLT